MGLAGCWSYARRTAGRVAGISSLDTVRHVWSSVCLKLSSIVPWYWFRMAHLVCQC